VASVDTNVLVRFLVADDPAQHALAARLFRDRVSAGELLFVPITVALELEWVLRSSFGFRKADVVSVFSDLLSTAELHFDAESAVEAALALFQDGNSDFADCLHIALAGQAGEQPLWTFDKAASKVDGAKLLTP
jgi:predicted nucleic-acid-binding protein